MNREDAGRNDTAEAAGGPGARKKNEDKTKPGLDARHLPDVVGDEGGGGTSGGGIPFALSGAIPRKPEEKGGKQKKDKG